MKKITRLLVAALALIASSNMMAQDEVVYTSAGYDVNAQKMVNFTWTAEDGFLSTDAPQGENLSTVAYLKNKQLHTLVANGEQQTLTVMDPETFEKKSQLNASLNAACGLPMSVFASEQYPYYTFAIASAKEDGVGERYYIAAFDETTAEVKRISTIGYWYDDTQKTSIAPITFFFSYGNAYLVYAKRQGGVVKVWLGQLNPVSGEIKETGTISAIKDVDPTKAVASIYYLSTTYRNYLVISPDGQQNSTIYYLPTFATNGEVACTEEVVADRVLAACYQRPSTISTYGTPTTPLAQPTDLKLDIDGTKITVTFTMPTTDAEGNVLTPDDWALTNDYSRSINVLLYMETSSVTMTKPEGVNYFFPGDNVTLTGDLSTVYGVTNPNGLHCFTLRIQPSNGYTGKSLRDTGVFALVGGAKPEPVSNAKAEKSGPNSAVFTWTAPTATEYSDWGYAFDGSALTYNIVRNNDGTIVAEGLTATTAEVDNLAKEPGNFDFSIYAYSNGTQSAGASTNAVLCEPPTYDFLGYNNTTQTIVAFNVDQQFSHTEWMQNANIGNEVGVVRGDKLLTTKYSYAKTQWSEYGWQTFSIFTAEQFVQQGYNFSNYWYPSNGAIIRHLLTAAYDPVLDRVFGIAVDSLRNADAEPVALRYFVVDVDSVGNYTAQNRIIDALGDWSLEDEEQNAQAILALAAFKGNNYAAVASRKDGSISYQLCTFAPMTQTLEPVATIDLPIDLSYGTQFFISTADKLYLGYNNGTDNTVVYEISTTDASLVKAFEMDGQYTYAYQRPSSVTKPDYELAQIAAPTIVVGEEGKATVSVVLPVLYNESSALESDLTVSILEDGKSVATATGAPGSTLEVADVALSDGLHLVTVVAQATIDGYVASTRAAANVIIGSAKPNAPTNAVAESFGDNEAQITWTAPTASLWADFGGKLTADDVLTYIVVQNQEEKTLVDDCVDPEYYVEAISEYDGWYDFTVYAVNGTQVSLGAKTNLVEVIGQLLPVGIQTTDASAATTTAIYNEAGQLTNRLQRGINIVHRSNGQTVKVTVK